MKVLRLGDVTESTQGIIPYKTRAEGETNLYIKPRQNVSVGESEWKALLDDTAFIGRYQLRSGHLHPYLKYGNWLCRKRDAKFFEQPKMLLVRLRNKALKRRLIATYDSTGFYNQNNYNNVIAKTIDYNLKYIVALFNSSLLNYWYSRTFSNVNINNDTFSQLPIYPASPEKQAEIVALVDEILQKHDELNKLREVGYVIRQQRNGKQLVKVPYVKLWEDLLAADQTLPILTFFEAKATSLFDIPAGCDLQASISSNIFISDNHPQSVVLRHNKLWFDVPDANVRRYLLGYLSDQRWQGKTWDEIKSKAVIPGDEETRAVFFEVVANQTITIQTTLDEIATLDAKIDQQVLDLYAITNLADRNRILGSIPALDEIAMAEDVAGEDNIQGTALETVEE